MGFLVDHSKSEDEYFMMLSYKLYEALASGKGIQHILDVAEEIFNNPILVADNSFRVIAHAESPNLNDELWNDIIKSGYYPLEYTDAVIKDDELSDKIYNEEITILSDRASPNRYLAKKIVVNGKPVGFSSCVEIERKFTPLDIKLFRVFCQVVGVELRHSDFVNITPTRRYEFLFCELLSGQVKTDFLNERIAQVGLKLKKYHFILVAEFKDGKMRSEQQMFYYRSRLEQVILSGYCAINRNTLIILISRQDDVLLTDDFIDSVSKQLEFADMICGVSNPFCDMADFSLYYKQACEAIKFSKRFSLPGRIFAYWQFSGYHLLEIASQTMDLHSFCDPRLKRILDYDAENHTQYTITAYQYLRSNRDPALTAKQLNVHRNTVDYRIKRFEINFNDQETVFSVDLSFRILRYISDSNFKLE